MITSLHDQLVRDEEDRQFVYTDSSGIPTIGVGRNLRDKGLSPLERAFMLSNDIADYTIEVLRALPWSGELDAVRFEVLVNMTLNMGIGSASKGTGLLGFHKFLEALKTHDYPTAAKEMLDSKWATQVGARAERLAQQIALGLRQ
jgi:lysozyme